MNRRCIGCKSEKQVISWQLFANGLYGYYCQECDEIEAREEASA